MYCLPKQRFIEDVTKFADNVFLFFMMWWGASENRSMKKTTSPSIWYSFLRITSSTFSCKVSPSSHNPSTRDDQNPEGKKEGMKRKENSGKENIHIPPLSPWFIYVSRP
jgi:hypothetical protein